MRGHDRDWTSAPGDASRDRQSLLQGMDGRMKRSRIKDQPIVMIPGDQKTEGPFGARRFTGDDHLCR